MDLNKSGKLLRDLRISKGMTQKQVAEQLGVLPKTVSKWETGHGFPDVSAVSALADILGVSERILLSGDLIKNMEEVGNMKKTKFYVCPHCGAIMQGTGEFQLVCCGKPLAPLQAAQADDEHTIHVSEIENDFYITFHHEMTKEHFISFLAYVTFDKVLLVKLYPEQDASARFPKMHGGIFYYYCNQHGLFLYKPDKRPKGSSAEKASLTSLMSAFSRAYHFENSENPIFRDSIARELFSDKEFQQMEQYIVSGGHDLKTYVNDQLAPTPLARARFCEDSLDTAIKTGTKQYVILGSGLDTFAFRNNYESIHIYEIDREITMHEKKQRLKRAKLEIPDNVQFLSADLSQETMEDVLEKTGFDKNKKTFFSCLGLLYYLTKDEIGKLLEGIAAVAADGSTVVFDFADNHLFSSNMPRVKNMLRLAEESSEPMKSCFSCEELERLLQQHNFLIYEFLSDKNIQTRYFSSCGCELSAFPHIHYALAVIKK